MVQRLGMDEIFTDVTQLVRSGHLGSGSTSSGGGSSNEDDAGGITGHLFSPGGGGTLLEAQTGLEISLDVGGGGGSGGSKRFDADFRDTNGASFSNARQDPRTKSPLTYAADTFGRNQEGRYTQSEDLASSQGIAEGVEGGMTDRDSPVKTTSGGTRCSESICVGEALGGEGKGDSGGGGFQGSTVEGRRRAGEGSCRCGCFERLSATSAFAERVRKGLLEVVRMFCAQERRKVPAALSLASVFLPVDRGSA